MLFDDEIRDEKLQYNTNSEAAKASALPSGENDIHEYLTVEETLTTSIRSKGLEHIKCTYAPLGKD